MKPNPVLKYVCNCFLLTLPIVAWNLVFASHLPVTFQPAIFWHDIPPFLAFGENISRVVVFLLTLLMPLSVESKTQKTGLVLYVAGTVLYCASWLALLYFPESAWSNSGWGFIAPAYTPALWLTGIGLIGRTFYVNLPYKRWLFISVSMVFLVFHNVHTIMIYHRTH